MITLRTKVVKLIEMQSCAKNQYNPIRHDGVIDPLVAFFHNFSISSLFVRELREKCDPFKNKSCKAY